MRSVPLREIRVSARPTFDFLRKPQDLEDSSAASGRPFRPPPIRGDSRPCRDWHAPCNTPSAMEGCDMLREELVSALAPLVEDAAPGPGLFARLIGILSGMVF